MSHVFPAIYQSIAACGSVCISLAACGSSGEGSSSDGGGGGAAETGTGTDAADGSTTDVTMSADGPSTDGGVSLDSSPGGPDAGDGGCFATVADASCWACATGPNIDLTWNAGCGSDPPEGYIIEWGQLGTGLYPDRVDAGDPCEGGEGWPECEDAASTATASCSYILRGLEAGAWCLITLAYDDAGNNSGPSNQFCITLPPHCP